MRFEIQAILPQTGVSFKGYGRDFEQSLVAPSSGVQKSSFRTNRYHQVFAAAWGFRTCPMQEVPQSLRSRRKIQINYTSFFKKLLRFSFWNIHLKCSGSSSSPGGRNPLKRLLSWLQKIFFSPLDNFGLRPFRFVFFLQVKVGHPMRRKNCEQNPLSGQTKSLQSWGGVR